MILAASRLVAALLALGAALTRLPIRVAKPVPRVSPSTARRSLARLLVSITLALGVGAQALAHDDDDDDKDCARPRDLVLVNGKIVTMDARNSIASSVTMRNGRIVAVGHRHGHGNARCARVTSNDSH